jgi:putative DNA primase/helicase
MKPFQPSRRKIDDLIDALKAITIIDSSIRPPTWTIDLPNAPANEIISMTNGLLHVPTRTLLSHTPHYFNHHSLSFPFEADAPRPGKWIAFLEELWGEDESSIGTLQEVMGYILAGGTEQQKIVLIVGPKRGGKGTIGRVLTGLLGAHNVAAPTLSSLSTNFGLQPLVGKPLALVSDARLSKKSDTGIIVERLLSVSGEDSLTIDRKYRDAWTGRLPTRFVILTNELPRLTDSSGALASRFIMLVLTKSFYGEENPKLTDELLTEAPSIFNWALVGLDRLTERGYFQMPDSSKEAIQQLEDLASPVGAFLRERCEIVADGEVEIGMLWESWKEWCIVDNRSPATKGTFGRDLRAAAPTIRRGRPRPTNGEDRPYVYLGIRLREEYSALVHGPRGPERPNTPRGPRGPLDGPMYSPPEDGWDRS